MAELATKFGSERQDWPTPDSLFDPLNREFGFTCDVAADMNNAKCAHFIDESTNALEQSWEGICWLNPPYGAGNLRLWARKAYEEAAHCIVVMLVPARTNTNWWHDYVMRAKEIRFVKGRPRFGNAIHGLPQPLAVVVFDGHNNTPIIARAALEEDDDDNR